MLISDGSSDVCSSDLKIRGILREMSSVRQDEVIDRLTPIIRGWANYHRSQMATRTFNKCDHQIWEALWRWACRRHPNKGKRWVKQRYFICLRGRDWRFGVKNKLLPLLCEFKKRAHIKVKAERSEEHTSELQSLMRNSYAV